MPRKTGFYLFEIDVFAVEKNRSDSAPVFIGFI